MADLLLLIALFIAQAGMIWSVFMLFRNQQVHRFLMALLEEVNEAAIIEIKLRHHDARWRLMEIRKVEYNDMMWHFWRPPRSWFPKLDLLINGNTTEEEYRNA